MPTAIATNAAAVLGIATSYAANKVIALTAVSGNGATVPVPPKAAFLSNIELDANSASGTPASGNVIVRWDAGGDVACTAEFAFTFVAGVTTSSRLCTDIPVDKWYRFPDAQGNVTPTFYLFIKVNSGTVDVPVGGARLVWTTDLNDQS